MTQAITDKQINAKADAKKAREAEKYARKLLFGQAKPADMEVFISEVLSSKSLRKLGFTSIKEQGRNALARTPTSKQITPDKEVPEMPDNSGNIMQAESASNKRKAISTRRRFEIFKRDNFTCQYCGAQPPSVVLHIDHIVPVAGGGGNEDENLVTACERCNLGKSSVPLDVVPKSLAQAAEEEAERAAQVEAHAQMIREANQKLEDAAWEVAEILEPGASEGWSHSKFCSVAMFVKKIGYSETLDAAFIAARAKSYPSGRFKYFCGVCWNKVRLQE